jgi:hypothetical protein
MTWKLTVLEFLNLQIFLNMNRVCCKECPWKNQNSHSIKWREYAQKVLGDKPHSCHMKTKDVWGKKNGITEETVCIGAKDRILNK